MINDVETIKIYSERHEAKVKSVSNLLATTANHNEVTSDIKTLRSKCDSLDVRVDSLSTEITCCAKSQSVDNLKNEILIAQTNISKILTSSTTTENASAANTLNTDNNHYRDVNKEKSIENQPEITRDIPAKSELLICMDSNQKFIEFIGVTS